MTITPNSVINHILGVSDNRCDCHTEFLTVIHDYYHIATTYRVFLNYIYKQLAKVIIPNNNVVMLTGAYAYVVVR